MLASEIVINQTKFPIISYVILLRPVLSRLKILANNDQTSYNTLSLKNNQPTPTPICVYRTPSIFASHQARHVWSAGQLFVQALEQTSLDGLCNSCTIQKILLGSNVLLGTAATIHSSSPCLVENRSLVGWLGKETKDYALRRLRFRIAAQPADGDSSCEGIGKEYVTRQGLLAYLLCI